MIMGTVEKFGMTLIRVGIRRPVQRCVGCFL
jgi:hypothetical protein